MLKLIIFDLDGPILDSFQRSEEGVQTGLAKLAREEKIAPEKMPLGKETYIKCWGYPGKKTADLMFPQLTERQREIIRTCWAKNELKSKIPLVKKAVETLRYLKRGGFLIALLTSRSHNLQFHLKDYPLENLFDFVQSRKNEEEKSEKIHHHHIFCPHQKPNLKALSPILKWASGKGIQKEEILMIDDTLVGLEAAKKADFQFLGVCTGPLSSTKDWGKYGNLDGNHVIHTIAELPSWLEKYEGM